MCALTHAQIIVKKPSIFIKGGIGMDRMQPFCIECLLLLNVGMCQM